MSIKVIGAGFGRTGTKSLQVALKQLGFGPCYHMETLIRNPVDVVYWQAAKRGDARWDTLFANFQSVVDFPGCLFVGELYQHYPGSKVILTVRDPEDWYRSVRATIYNAAPNISTKLKFALVSLSSRSARDSIRLFLFAHKLIWKEYFQGRFLDKSFAIERYHQHIERILHLIPAEDLLVFDVKDGWRPLCAFLQVPVPDQSFPQLNRRDTFNYWLNKNVGVSVVKPQ